MDIAWVPVIVIVSQPHWIWICQFSSFRRFSGLVGFDRGSYPFAEAVAFKVCSQSPVRNSRILVRWVEFLDCPYSSYLLVLGYFCCQGFPEDIVTDITSNRSLRQRDMDQSISSHHFQLYDYQRAFLSMEAVAVSVLTKSPFQAWNQILVLRWW